MHIGIVTFTDVEYGLDLGNALVESGHIVSLYMSSKHASGFMGSPIDPSSQMVSQGLLHPDVKVNLFGLRRMRDLRSFWIMRKIAHVIQQDSLDAVHVLMGGGEVWTAVLAYLLRANPVVSTMIIPRPNVGEYPPPAVVRLVNAILGHASDIVLVNGVDDVEHVERTYRLKRGRVRFVPLGPRTAFPKLSDPSIQEEPGSILFFGRMNRHKGLEILLRAHALILVHAPEAKIVIAGQGDELDRLRPMIENNPMIDLHEGYLAPRSAAKLFQKAAIVAVPYISAATSGVLMTAYGFSKPVVATRTGNLPDYVREGITGLLVPPADVQALAKAIVGLLSDDDERSRMGHAANDWIQGELSWESISQATVEAYQVAIARHRGEKMELPLETLVEE